MKKFEYSEPLFNVVKTLRMDILTASEFTPSGNTLTDDYNGAGGPGVIGF